MTPAEIKRAQNLSRLSLMIPKHIIHLLSGGLDSVTLLHDLVDCGSHVHCLLFDYKQRHVQELQFAKWHARKLNVLFTTIELPPLGGLTEGAWIVPNRNCIFLSIAANLAARSGSDTITIGCNASDAEAFSDCRREFIDAFNGSLKAAEISVEVCAPYLDWPKSKIARHASDMGIAMADIWTCYKGGPIPCGECPACRKLKEATS